MTTHTDDSRIADNGITLNASSSLENSALRLLFKIAQRARWMLPLLKPVAVWGTVAFSDSVMRNVRSNASSIFGRELSARDQRSFSRAVVGYFYDAVADLGRGARQSIDNLKTRIDRIEGAERYLRLREQRRGAVLVTAHMGAFEVGLAALRQIEQNVHVVFKRDEFQAFEDVRSRLRAALVVREAPVDDGLPSLLGLRDALLADHVVVMQADRAMKGQRSQVVPFLHGHLCMPLGPAKLAHLTNSPIVPVFVVRGCRGRFIVHIEDAIEPDQPERTILLIASAIQKFVARYPEQWLVLDRAFVDDADSEG